MDSDDVRERLKRQREKWMKERDMYKDKNEVEKEIRSAYPQQQHQNYNPNSFQPELVDKLFIKMSERLEKKFAGGTLQSKIQAEPDEQEKSLQEQVMSNTCPICLELFLPPNNQPFILFPCGHTFCKICINNYAKEKNKCPYCRQLIKSMAPNISLQNLILSANDKKEEVIKRLKLKQEQMIKNNEFGGEQISMKGQQIDIKVDAERYINDFKLLDIRCGVLEEEKSEYVVQVCETKDKMRAIEKTLSALSIEKEDCIARLRKVQQELDLIKEFEEKQQDSLEDLKQDRLRQEQGIKFIDDALGPLKAEKDKAKMMVQTIAPHLAHEVR